MHASTQLYLELQRIYRDKAEADAAQGVWAGWVGLRSDLCCKLRCEWRARSCLLILHCAALCAPAPAVEGYVRELLGGVGRDPGSISPADIRHFCKNARYIR